MKTNDAPVPVDETDREAAADLANALGMECETFTEGAADVLVQHLARHRLGAVASATVVDGMEEAIADAIDKADAAFSYSFNLTRLVDGEETHTLTMPGFEPVSFIDDREEGYALIAQRRNASRASAIRAAVTSAHAERYALQCPPVNFSRV